MAKKKSNTNQESSKNFTPDMQMLTHKYSDHYRSDTKDEKIQRIDESKEDEDFVWYDTKEVFYPIYKAKVLYEITKEQEIHPLIVGILKIINELEKLRDKNTMQKLLEITQLDTEIFGSIMSDLATRALIKQVDSKLSLTDKGREAIKKEKEKIKEQTSAFVAIDGIFGDVIDKGKSANDVYLDSKVTKDAIELKPESNTRPRTESLGEIFGRENENKTLRQVLRESLKNLDDEIIIDSTQERKEKTQKYDIDDIIEIEGNAQKYYKKYWCLFYKSMQESEKILVINDKYEIDSESTKLFEKLIDTSNFKPTNQKAKAYQDNTAKFENLTPEQIKQQLAFEKNPDIIDGKTINVTEHKAYLKYALKTATNAVYIQSPWIRNNVLEKYKDDIESCLKRNVKIIIKYGLKPRNKHDKVGIDKESESYLNGLAQQYPKMFSLKKDNNHSKILICDKKFMIIGSFNWLSFGGEKQDNEKKGDKEMREETSVINTNKDSIAKEQQKFK